MNINHTEKKWFVYLHERQEGPFSHEELKIKLKDAQISAGTYLWCEGMVDWAPLYEALPELADIKLDIEQLEKPPVRAYQSRKIERDGAPREPARGRLGSWLLIVLILLAAALLSLTIRFRSKPAVQARITRLERAAAPYLARFAAKYPSVLNFISDIPDLPNVAPADLERLRRASLTQYDRASATLVIVPAQNSDNRKLYLASGLPDGTRFDLHVTGVSNTLLGSLSASATVPVEIRDHFSLVEITAPLPQGSYVISAVPAAGSPNNAQITLSETFFLGQRNEDYERGVRDYHAKIRAQAAAELAELHQLADSLEDFLSAKKSARSHPLPPKSPNFPNYNDELAANIARWSSPEFAKTVYYGPLYQAALQASQAVMQYNDLRNQSAHKRGDAGSLGIRIAEAISVAKNAVINLESKIDLAERIIGTGELPEREGL